MQRLELGPDVGAQRAFSPRPPARSAVAAQGGLRTVPGRRGFEAGSIAWGPALSPVGTTGGLGGGV